MSADITPSWAQVHPSMVLPEIIMQYQQASGAFNMLPNCEPLVRLGKGMLQVYAKVMNIRTKSTASTHAANILPGVSITSKMINVPTYLIRSGADYDHHDIESANNWGYSLPEAQRLGMRQGIYQIMRNALLYGMNPSTGEGLANTAGATAVTLPPDSNGNQNVSTYDPGQMAIFLLTQIGALKARMMHIGMPTKIRILTPQRVQSQLTYSGIVQLTQFQREGAGTDTVAGMVERVAGEVAGDDVEWELDDTLIGAGTGGTDLIIIDAPVVKKPIRSGINTNEFATLTPGMEATVLMLSDMSAPMEIVSPLSQGGTNVISEIRVTPGWGLRPEAITLISMAY